MPTVVAGALVSAVGLSGIVATAATSVLGVVSSFALQSLVAKPRKNSLTASERSELVRSPVLPRRAVYGQARVSGPLVFAATTDSSTSSRKDLLHLVIPLCSHQLEGLQAVFINEERVELTAGSNGWLVPVAGSKYRRSSSSLHYLQLKVHDGASDQLADADLVRDVPSWTSAHRLRGIAYIYVKLLWDSSIWAGGLPNISALVQGRAVYDPRSVTTTYSGNPALCIRDYLLADWGLGCSADEIDEDSFNTAANLCDELVPLSGSDTEERRYSLNGVISYDQKPIDVVEQMLSSCGGALVYTGGRYRLFPAAYRLPTLALDESVLRGPVKLRPQSSSRERANSLRGTYIEPTQNWQQADYKPVLDELALANDQNLIMARELDLPFTISHPTAERLARLQLARIQNGLTIELPCSLAALQVAVMEPVLISMPTLGWVDKVFVPIQWQISSDGNGVDLVLQADDPSLYAWDGGTAARMVTATPSLPTAHPDTPVMQVDDQLDANGQAQLVVDLSSAIDAFTLRYEVDYRPQGEQVWRATSSGVRTEISGVQVGQSYELRARCVNLLGLSSSWVYATHQARGNIFPPSTPQDMVGRVVESSLHLTWIPAGAQVAGYSLRWSPEVVGAQWAQAVEIVPRLSGQLSQIVVPVQVGTYLLKAINALGQGSVAPAYFINLTPDPAAHSLVYSTSEHPTFGGSKTNCVLDGSGLVIDSLNVFDGHQASLFDSASDLFDAAGGGVQAEGVYTFASVVDLGARYSVRVQADLAFSVVDYLSDFDSTVGAFDGREGEFDGTAQSLVDVKMEASLTDDDPASPSATWSLWQSCALCDVVARGLRLRLRLISQDSMLTPHVTVAGVRLSMAQQVLSGANITASSTGSAISFTPAFKEAPAIAISLRNGAAGDRWALSSISRSGFTVQFFDSSGAAVSRSFDWVAKGVGRQI
jgi:hypothetical protein